MKTILKGALVLAVIVAVPTGIAMADGNDTSALMAVIDSQAPQICQLAQAAVAAGNDPAVVVEHGTVSFDQTFNPSDTVVEHMRAVLTACVA